MIKKCVVAAMCFLPVALLAQKPDWVEKRPTIEGTYVGIGIVQKNGSPAEYTEASKNAALNDIASQITVAISGEVLRRVLESNSTLKEEFQSQVRASARAELEGIRIVDTYQDDAGFWTYCTLSKAEYAARRAAKLRNATTMALDLFAAGQKAEQSGDLTQALRSYVQAFGPMEKYLGEPLEAEFGGRSILLVNETYASVQRVLDKIELKSDATKAEGKIGRPLRGPWIITAATNSPPRKSVARLPLAVKFTRGAGDVAERTETSEDGTARCLINKITSPDRIQIVEARVVLLPQGSAEQAATPLSSLFGSFSIPSARLVLNVSGVETYVDATESMFGEPLKQKRIEPVVKTRLGDQGFAFVGSADKASLLITIKCDARKGSQAYGLSFAYVSAEVSVVDMESGKEIFKSALHDVKEGADSYEKAALKAFTSAATKLADEMVPAITEKVQR